MQARFTQIFDNIRSITYYYYQTSAKIIISTLQSSEKILIGDLRKLNNMQINQLDYTVISLGLVGYMFGNQYLVMMPAYPDKEDQKTIMTTCDAQPKGRIAYQGFAGIAGGQHFFAENSKKIHLSQMRDFKSYLQNSIRYAELLDEELKKLQLDNYNDIRGENAKHLVRHTFLKVFFNLDKLPAGLHKAIDSYAANAFMIAESVFGGWELMRSTYQAKKDYHEFSERFLFSQIDHLMKILENYPASKGQNIVADVIVSKFKEKYPSGSITKINKKMVAELLRDPYIKSLPSVFFAGDNTIRVIDETINYLQSMNGYLAMKNLQEELEAKNVNVETASLRDILEGDLTNIHSIYKTALEKISPQFRIARTTDCEIKLSKATIPANSKIIVSLNNTPFSIGKRSCPGSNIAEIMVSTVILRYISKIYKPIINFYEKPTMNENSTRVCRQLKA